MWEMVYNLVDNGIRYGRENGFVSVRVDCHGLTVIDDDAFTGAGVKYVKQSV